MTNIWEGLVDPGKSPNGEENNIKTGNCQGEKGRIQGGRGEKGSEDISSYKWSQMEEMTTNKV